MPSAWPVFSNCEQAETISIAAHFYSSSAISIATLSLLGLWILTRYIHIRFAEARFKKIHGCRPPYRVRSKWPLSLDLVVQVFRKIGEKKILQWFVGWLDLTGPTFELDALGAKIIYTVEPDNIETILSTKFTSYSLGNRHRNFGQLFGDGVFTQDGAHWRHSRELLRPLFSLNRSNILMEIEEHTEQLVQHMSSDEFIDLQPLFFRFTLDTITFLLFGKSMHSLRPSPPQDAASTRMAEFTEAFRVAQEILFRRERLGDFYWIYKGKEYHRNCSIVHSFIDEIVQAALLEAPQTVQAGDAKFFLGALIHETRDHKALRDHLLNLLLAGRDTTACCLTWTFRLLAQHPDVLAKLRSEIDSVVGVGDGGHSPDRNLLKKMRYLNMVLKEVLRLYPPVPINGRWAVKATTLPKGGGPDGTKPIMVRKGEGVMYFPYVMHRFKRLYGEDVDTFRPERWDPDVDNPVNLKNIGYGYLPFNGGPRICLGQEFALLEASYVVVRMLQKFRSFELHPGDKDIAVGTEKQEITLVLASFDGCRIRMVN